MFCLEKKNSSEMNFKSLRLGVSSDNGPGTAGLNISRIFANTRTIADEAFEPEAIRKVMLKGVLILLSFSWPRDHFLLKNCHISPAAIT